METPTVKKRLAKKKIRQISEGLLSTVTDAVLFTLFLPAASLGTSRSSYGVYQTFQGAHELLKDINYQTLKHAVYKLKKKGLIKGFTRGLLNVQITQVGKERLKSLIPRYQEIRPWNKMMYLVNYDIKVENNQKRDFLRNFLKTIGASKLQHSLYLTPYNPKTLISEFVKNNSLKGQVLISELGKDSSIGDFDLKDLISKVYHLKELNQRYQDFIEKYKNSKKSVSKSQVALEFYAVLKDDPQVPFELLPPDFLSDEAYLLFKKLTS